MPFFGSRSDSPTRSGNPQSAPLSSYPPTHPRADIHPRSVLWSEGQANTFSERCRDQWIFFCEIIKYHHFSEQNAENDRMSNCFLSSNVGPPHVEMIVFFISVNLLAIRSDPPSRVHLHTMELELESNDIGDAGAVALSSLRARVRVWSVWIV